MKVADLSRCFIEYMARCIGGYNLIVPMSDIYPREDTDVYYVVKSHYCES